MPKLILTNYEHDVLRRLLEAVPPAHLTRILPDCTGADLRFYRDLLTKVTRQDHRFPDTDDGEEQPIYGYTLEQWNSMDEDEQIRVQDDYEYRLQHPEQADWFVD